MRSWKELEAIRKPALEGFWRGRTRLISVMRTRRWESAVIARAPCSLRGSEEEGGGGRGGPMPGDVTMGFIKGT